MRRHLSYANLTATFALVVALATGGAYAADLIGSEEIRDNSIRSVDLRDGRAVKAKDVRRNSLGGQSVDEGDLGLAQGAAIAHGARGSCELANPFVDCATAELRLPRQGHIVVVASGAFYGDGGSDGTSASCEIQMDGVGEPVEQTPGETTAGTSALETDGFARTRVFRNVTSGVHELALACREIEGEARIGTSTVLALGLTKR